MDDFDDILALYSHPSWRVSWDALEARARTRLDGTGQVPPAVRRGQPFHGLPRLRLWNDPGGMAYEVEPTTWSVFELFTDTWEREPVVREAVWQRTADGDRVRDAVGSARNQVFLAPTVSVRFGRVPSDELAEFIREGCAFRLPVAWLSDTESVTSDVGSVGFEFFSRDQPPASLRLTWSFDTADDWKPVIEWYYRLQEFLTTCVATAEIPFATQ